MELLITGNVNYGNGSSDIVDFEYDYPTSDLQEALKDIERHLDNISGRSRGGVKEVEYVIYHIEPERKNDDDYMDKTLAQGTDYFIKYNSNLEVEEIYFDGLMYNGKEIKEFESYKVLGYDSFEEFVDDVAYDLERDYDDIEVPSYEILKEPSLSLLKNGDIYEAREHIAHDILG